VAERLTPEQIVALERADEERFAALEKGCDRLIQPDPEQLSYDECRDCRDQGSCRRFTFFSRLIRCGAGLGSFSVGYDGTFRLCSSLWVPGTTCDLRRGTLREACETLVPRVRAMRTVNEALLQCCGSCPYDNLCLCCPAHAYLETGDPEAVVPYFCQVARARAAALTEPNAAVPPEACVRRFRE